MRFSRLIFALFLLLAAGLPACAADSADVAHLRVQILVPAAGLSRGGAAPAGLYFKLEPGWHVYWKNAGDSGEPPHMKWTLPVGVTASELKFPAPKRLPLGPLMDFGYEDEVVFPFSITVAKSAAAGSADLSAKVDWLVCREVCIPGKAELDVTRTVGDGGPRTVAQDQMQLIQRFEALVPKPAPGAFKPVFQPEDGGFRLAVTTGHPETSAVFFPAVQSVVNNPSPQIVTPTAKGLVLEVQKDADLAAAPDQLRGVLELSDGRAFDVTARPGSVPGASKLGSLKSGASVPTTAPAPAAAAPGINATTVPVKSTGLLQSAGLAFLGGLLLNLMPCVFPVLFIKALALVRSSGEERHTLRAHGFVYAAGIVVSFWALVAVLLGLRAAGSHLGWGYQFQSPVFLALMASLLFFLGLSLAGQFEIGLTFDERRWIACGEAGLCGQLFYGRACGDCGDAVHGAVYGCGGGLCAGAVDSHYFCCVYGAGPGFGRAVCRVDLAAGLDALFAKARRVDGIAEASNRGAGVWDCDLAGMGAGAGVRCGAARSTINELLVDRDGGMVSWPVAGAAVGFGDCDSSPSRRGGVECVCTAEAGSDADFCCNLDTRGRPCELGALVRADGEPLSGAGAAGVR